MFTSNYRRFLAVLLVGWAILTVPAAQLAKGDEFDKLEETFWKRFDAERYTQGEKIARQMIEMARQANDPEQMADGLRCMANIHLVQDRIQEAEKMFTQVAETRKKALGAKDGWYGDSLADLAEVYSRQGRYGESERLYRQALSIMRAAWGDDDEDVTRVTANLVDVQTNALAETFWEHYGAARYDEAEKVARQVIEIGKAHQANAPERMADGLSLLAQIHVAHDRLAEAEKVIKQVVEIRKAALGETDGWYGDSLADLADVYFQQGRDQDAERLYEQALAIMRAAWDDDDEDVARVGTNLADAQMAQGDYSRAVSLYQKAVEVFQDVYGEDAAELGPFLLGLARVYRDQDRYDDAEKLCRRALQIAEQQRGKDHVEVAYALVALTNLCGEREQHAKATATGERALEILEQAVGEEHPDLVDCLDALAYAYSNEGHYAEAERTARRILAIQEKALGPVHLSVADALVTLGSVYSVQNRLLEAETLFTRALSIQEKTVRSDSYAMTTTWLELGLVYANQGRYSEADSLLKRAQAVNEKALGAGNLWVADPILVRGQIYAMQSRYDEAEILLKQARAMLKQIYGEDHSSYGYATERLAWLYLFLERNDEAEEPALKAVQITEKAVGPDGLAMADPLSTLANVYAALDRYEEAEPLFARSLAILEKQLGRDNSLIAHVLTAQAEALHDLGRRREAEPLLDRAIALYERSSVGPDIRAAAYYIRAQAAWDDDRRSEALADLRRAMDLAEQQRGLVAGAEREQAGMFAEYLDVFEKMVEWQTELGDVSEALSAIERSKARSLLDELTRPGVDLQLGRSSFQRKQLRQREDQFKAGVAELEKQLELLAGKEEADEQREDIQLQLTAARKELYRHYRDSRSSSPIYRSLLTVGSGPPRMSQIRRRLVGNNCLMLVYMLGEDGGYLVSISPKRAELAKLEIDQKAAQAFGIEPGPLTAKRLQTILMNDERTGVLQQTANPLESAKATERLATLWKLLVPEDRRDELTSGNVGRLIVVPDGPLSLLPFETLVVASDRKIKYLLDVGPPIIYGPSASVLFNLDGRAVTDPPADLERVLTVGNPSYPVVEGAQPAQRSGHASDQLRTRSRYSTAGGPLARLPNSGTESRWVSQMFEQQGVTVTDLLADDATELKVRQNAAGRTWLHLACHGLVDQSHGNFFGALALSPATGDTADPANDGFLTLAEICGLELQSCELAILSACETNYGPEQRGEGVWGLSRGFLVAGSHRVLASNWLVDDEAAASLICVFCSDVAKGEKTGQVDYAQALHNAKRWVRDQSQWESPYYWATFVLVGPN